MAQASRHRWQWYAFGEQDRGVGMPKETTRSPTLIFWYAFRIRGFVCIVVLLTRTFITLFGRTIKRILLTFRRFFRWKGDTRNGRPWAIRGGWLASLYYLGSARTRCACAPARAKSAHKVRTSRIHTGT
jgi:hypothetical protein